MQGHDEMNKKGEGYTMHYRHGDVNLIRVSRERFEQMRASGTPVSHDGKFILARGEATGSVHEIACADMELIDNDGTLFLRIGQPATITHTSDHDTIVAEPDYYVQVPEREVDHFGDSIVRKVVD